MLKDKLTTVKNYINEHLPEILLGTALVASTAAITYALTPKGEETPDEDWMPITRSQFQHMIDTDDSLLIRTNIGDFRLHRD